MQFRFAPGRGQSSAFAQQAVARLRTIPGVAQVESQPGTDAVQIRFQRPVGTLLREIHRALQTMDTAPA